MEINRQASFWESDALLGPFQCGIIGSGLVGLGAALEWKQQRPNDEVAVFERDAIPAGASTRNAGFACFGSATELLDDLEVDSETAVWDLVAARWEGLLYLRQLLGDPKIKYESLGGFEVFRTGEDGLFNACINALPYLNQQLERITGVPNVFELRDDLIKGFGFSGITHIILNKLEGQLHPGLMFQELESLSRKAGIKIFLGMEVASFEDIEVGIQVQSKTGYKINCEKLIVASNGFSKHLFPDLEMQPARNQVLITKPIPGLSVRGTFHYDRGYYYFRNVGDRLLLGGGRHLYKTQEETDSFGLTDNIYENLVQLLDKVILPGQNWELDQKWSGILGVGPQKKPIFRFHDERIFLALRLGGMGVALGAKLGASAARKLLKID